MVNINSKRVFISLLASIMMFSSAVSFTACSKGNKVSKSNKTPKFVYEAKFKELGTIDADYVSGACITEDGVYMSAPHYEYDENYNVKSFKNYLIICDLEDNKIDMKEMKDLRQDEYINYFSQDKEGNMIMITNISSYNEKTDESKSEYYMINVDREGKFSNRIHLKPDLKKDEYLYPNKRSTVCIDDKLLIGSESKVYTFNKDGSAGKSIELDNYIECMFVSNNGKVYIMSEVDGKLGIYELNIETGKLGDFIDCGDYQIYSIDYIKQLDNGNVYLGNSDGIFECNFEKNKLEFLFSWINVDIDNNNVIDFQSMEDGNITVVSYTNNYSESGSSSSCDIELASVEKKKYSEVKQKSRITFAVIGMDGMLSNEIIKYNKTSEDYRIEVIDYSSYEDPQKQMNLDITTGKIPDIIDANCIPKEKYVKKGLLTDLYALMEKDNEVRKEDFIDSVCKTLEYNGKLYYISGSFSMTGFIGSKNEFGDAEGWSYKDMLEKYRSMSKDKIFINNMTREWFINNMLNRQLEDFINYKTGDVNLDSEEFINMLEFSKNFESVDEYFDDESDIKEDDEYIIIKNGKLLLKEIHLYDFSEIQVNEILYKNQGGFTILSAPSKDKNNKISLSSLGSCYAISEKCSDKEGAWNFLKRFYTYEYQKKTISYGGFPTRKDVLDKMIEYAMATKEYTDDDGTEVKPVSELYAGSGFEMKLKPYTKEQMDIFRSLVDRIGNDFSYNTLVNEITEMIVEEAEAFYAGDKTAKETAEILQSRVKIYVSENS